MEPAAKAEEPEAKSPQPEPSNSNQVIVVFKNVGGAPILKQSKFRVSTNKKIAHLLGLVRKAASFEPGQSIFIYINQSFAPSPDQTIQNLYDCYACDNKLVLHYSITVAWG